MIRFAAPFLLLASAACSMPGGSGSQASAGGGGTQPGSSGSAPATPAPPVAPSRYSAAQTVDAAIGTWRGSYTCPQGPTGLDVVLERDGADRLRGTFRFYPLPQNPSVPHGCFTVTATAEAGGRLSTNAGEWVTHPPDYLLGDIVGTINNDGSWSGNLRTVGQCGGFLLRRTDAPPAAC